jgi:hypothetical protein
MSLSLVEIYGIYLNSMLFCLFICTLLSLTDSGTLIPSPRYDAPDICPVRAPESRGGLQPFKIDRVLNGMP